MEAAQSPEGPEPRAQEPLEARKHALLSVDSLFPSLSFADVFTASGHTAPNTGTGNALHSVFHVVTGGG